MRIIIAWAALLILGCGSTPVKQNTHITEPPKPEMVWTHDQLYADSEAGKIAFEEVNHRFLVDSETCKIQGLQVPIPSPSCSTVQPPNCDSMDAVSKTLCLMQRPYQDCDYSSVNAAYDAQRRITESCMKIRGWRLVEDVSGEEMPPGYTPQHTFIDSMLSKEIDKVMEDKIGIDIQLLSPSDSIKERLMRWSYAVRFEEYRNASPQEQLKMRDEYFQKALASKYEKEHLEMMRADFEIFSTKIKVDTK